MKVSRAACATMQPSPIPHPIPNPGALPSAGPNTAVADWIAAHPKVRYADSHLALQKGCEHLRPKLLNGIQSYSSERRCFIRTTQQLSITLPNDMADVKSKVLAGEYASESEVIREGLRALIARDRAVETWLHREVGAAHDALKADPSRAVTAKQVRARLAAERAKTR
jgi:Arc/MetJ-type ribon-helix-helix transcriptional regulator